MKNQIHIQISLYLQKWNACVFAKNKPRLDMF